MHKTIHPSFASGVITAPSSKSMTQRAIAAALLSHGATKIYHPSWCNDSIAALDMARTLGAEVVQGVKEITILGGFLVRGQRLNCGESGLAMRMFAPIASLHRKQITFTGEGSLPMRPVSMIGEALSQLGVDFHSNNGFLPFSVQGPLKGGKAIIDGSISSQLLTGLLMALPLAETDSLIQVNNLKSKPYIAMTIRLLQDYGVVIGNHNFESFSISGGQKYQSPEYTVEGDWSGGAFLLVAGAINGNIMVKGLRQDSEQSDKAIIDVLNLSGANMRFGDNSIEVYKSRLLAFDFDATECPDLFPPLAALAAYCEGTTRIKGIDRLIHKESNRAIAIQQELAKLGVSVLIEQNDMLIKGSKITGGTVNSHNDHRIAMMAAIMALGAGSAVTIEKAGCVAKSYPGFFTDLFKLGVKTEE